MNEARKDDAAKIRMDLLPSEFIQGTAVVLTFGANKYGVRNWEDNGGMSWGRCFAALMRHMWSWWNPFEPDTDDETGYSHLWHASCCLAFLIAYEQRKIGKDDRTTHSNNHL